MQAQLRITEGDQVDEIASLWDWLRDEPKLLGLIQQVGRPIGPTDLSGGVVELLTVAVGSGSVAAVLAQSLNTWLRTRRSTVTLTVSVNDRKVTLRAHSVDGQQVDQTLSVLRDVLTGSVTDSTDLN